MDYDYIYSYLKEEKFDIAGAITSIATAVAVGALTGGAGAMAMAGLSATANASGMTKGNIDIETNYDETIVANNINGNNINITTGNDFNSVSTVINNNTLVAEEDREIIDDSWWCSIFYIW